LELGPISKDNKKKVIIEDNRIPLKNN
jgi:hypothetical protein